MAKIINPSPAGFLRGPISGEDRKITRDFLKYLQTQEQLVQAVAALVPALVAGANITLTPNADGTTTITASGGGSSLQLKVNGTLNAVQILLNLLAGSGVSLTDNGAGGVTVKANLTAGSGITLTDNGAAGLAIAAAQQLVLKVNGANAALQSLLNLKPGSNVTIVDDGAGGITISAVQGAIGLLDLPSAINPGKVRGIIYSPNANNTLGSLGDLSIQTLGTFTYAAPTSTEGASGKLTAGAVLGGQSTLYHSNNRGVSRGSLKYYYVRAALGNTGTANWWAGITNVNPGATLMQTSPTTQNLVMFAWVGSVVANNFAAIACDGGGTPTIVDTGVAADTNFHDFLILFSAGKADFYIDGVLRATITTHLPSDSLDSDAVITQQNTSGTAGFMFFEHEWWSS